MNAAKVHADEYMDFLIATPQACSATEAARVQPDGPRPPAHDAFTRLLTRLEADPQTLWTEAEPQVRRGDGLLVIDDSTLDTPYATAIELVTRHWSGKHQAVVRGINLVSLLWTDGDRHIPCDYRVHAAAYDGKTKNDHFREMFRTAHARGFRPRCVEFGGWYGSLENLKAVRACGWVWLTRLKGNRLVKREREGTRSLSATAISADGTVVWLPGFGLVKVFGIVAPDGDTTYWATNDLAMTARTRRQYAEFSWAIDITTGGSSRAPGRSGASVGRRWPSGTTSGWPCGRSCGWRSTTSPPASVGWRRRRPSSATPSAPTWSNPATDSPNRQLRNI